MGKTHLSIGTSVAGDRINLIDEDSQAVYEWEPSETPLEDTFSESSLGDGRQLSAYREKNAIESMRLHIKGSGTNPLVRNAQDIRRMLIKARDYWVTIRQGYPVYLAARGACETNMRYALVYTGQLPKDVLPWGDAFGRAHVMNERSLVLERGPWLDAVPGSGTCIEITGGQVSCFPGMLVFDGTSGEVVNGGSDAVLDDLPDNAVAGKGYILVDGWIRANSYGVYNIGAIIGKVFWVLYVGASEGLMAEIACLTRNAESTSGLDEFTADGEWHHVCMVYDEAGVVETARTIYLAIDGTWVNTYATQITSQGNYTSDASSDIAIGNVGVGTSVFDGDIGWLRVSDTNLYTVDADFTPPARCDVPIPTANTLGLWIYEGDGVTTGNLGAGATAATISSGIVWGCDCPTTFGYDPDEETTPAVDEWWDPEDAGLCVYEAHSPIGALSFNAALLDLTGNGNHAANPGGANQPGWDVLSGWDFDGVNDYLTTTFIPDADQTQSFIIQFSNFVGVGAFPWELIFGMEKNTYGFAINPNLTSGPSGNIRGYNGSTDDAGGGVGFNGPGTIGIAGSRMYKNGAAVGPALINAWGGEVPVACYIGAANVFGAASLHAEVCIQRIAVYSCNIGAAGMLAVHNAIMAL